MTDVSKGPLIIFSGPAGSGKTTVVRRVLEKEGSRLRQSVAATTRAARHNAETGVSERDGVDYHFWTRDQFERGIAEGEFLEWADVFGHLYGTPKTEVEPYREQGIGVILVIDVQGAAQVREKCPDAVSIFLRAPGLEDYEQRLRQRNTETEEVIQRRLAGARRELERAGEYDYQVVNDNLDQAVAEVQSIIHSLFERGKNAR
jgi:guanylate kinase